MNSTYKVVLIVAIVICVAILGYYISQDRRKPIANTSSTGQNSAVPMADTASLPPTQGNGASSISPLAIPPVTHGLIPPPPAIEQSSLGEQTPATASQAVTGETPTTGNMADYQTDASTASGTTINTTIANTSDQNNTIPPSNSKLPNTGRAALKHNPPTSGKTYTVKSGDTFSSIAKKVLGDSSRYSEIAEANPYIDPLKLRVGQVLRLPETKSAVQLDQVNKSSTGHQSASRIDYVVRSGDTLSSIAKSHYNNPKHWDIIFRANRATIGNDPAGIRPGMKLFIPPDPEAAH